MHRLSLVLALCLLLAGCGGAADPAAPGQAGPNPGAALVLGHVSLGVPVDGVPVRVVDERGIVLAESVTDGSGRFEFAAGALPSEFRVVAAVGPHEFGAEVEEHDGASRYLVVNVPTTLASQWFRSHPDSTRAEAEAAIRSRLGLPDTAVPSLGLDESVRGGFSHVAFWAAASQAGGWEAFSSTLLAGAQVPRFRLDTRSWKASLDGLEPALQPWARRAAANPNLVLAGEAGQGESSLAGSVLTSVGEGIASSVLDAGISSAWTWVAQCLGLNFGTGPALAAIQSELDALIAAVAALQVELDEQEYTQGVNALNVYTGQIDTLNHDYSGAVASAHLTDRPSSPAKEVTDLLASLSQFTADTALEQIQDYMLGANGGTNMITLARKIQLHDSLGVDQPHKYLFAPLRSSRLLGGSPNPAQPAGAPDPGSPYFFYEGYQSLAANFLAENAKAAAGARSPVTAIQTADPTLRDAARSLKLQRQQLHAPLLSDEVIVDLQFGVMWYVVVHDADDWSSAKARADAFVLPLAGGGVYDDWRLPTVNELLALRERGRYNPHKDSRVPGYHSGASYGDYSQCSAGLTGLGFQGAQAIDSDGNVWCMPWFRSVYDGSWQFQTNTEFRMNHQHSNDNTSIKSTSTRRPFLLCRSLATPVLDPTTSQSLADAYEGDFPAQMVHPLRDEEFPGLGIPTGIGGVTSSGPGQAEAQVTWTVYLGGPTTCGTSKKSSHFSVKERRTTRTLAATSRPELLGMLAFDSQDTAHLDVSNYPGQEGRLLWHSPTGPVNVTASLLGYDGTNVVRMSASGSMDPGPNPPAATLEKIVINGRNTLYGPPPQQGTLDFYFATAFYSDYRVQDVTGRVVWTVTDRQGNPVTGARFRPEIPGALEIQPSLTVEELSLHARLGESADDAHEDSTKIEVLLP